MPVLAGVFVNQKFVARIYFLNAIFHFKQLYEINQKTHKMSRTTESIPKIAWNIVLEFYINYLLLILYTYNLERSEVIISPDCFISFIHIHTKKITSNCPTFD